MKNNISVARICVCSALAAMGMTTVVYAKTTAWIGSGGDALWSTAGNWNNGLPAAGDAVSVSNLTASAITVENDMGNLTFARGPFDLKRQVRLILRTFESAAREKNLALKSEIGELPVIELDEQRARQVLFNLVGNAVKYTDAGGVTVSASFERTSAREGTLHVAVRDTGIGIAAADIAKLMRPYVRLQGRNARGGTGLGLAICKRIVENMGGHIAISSEPGRGSVFAVLLPNVPYRNAGEPAPAVAGAGSANAAGAALPPRDFSALRVLVVDDLEMNRRELVASCRRLGAGQTAEAASSDEANMKPKASISYNTLRGTRDAAVEPTGTSPLG